MKILMRILVLLVFLTCKSLSVPCENLATGKTCCDDLETYDNCVDTKNCCWLALSNMGFISESCSMPNKESGETKSNFCTNMNRDLKGKMGTKIIKCGCHGQFSALIWPLSILGAIFIVGCLMNFLYHKGKSDGIDVEMIKPEELKD